MCPATRGRTARGSVSRYFFHVYDSISIVDKVGVELESLAEAQVEAVCRTGRYLLSAPEMFWHSDTWHMEVTDNKGFLYFRIDMRTSAPRNLSS
ncbi:MAG: DUF6894 family protein [Caulobacteraceae bacterium]